MDGSRLKLAAGKTKAIIFHEGQRIVNGVSFKHREGEIILSRIIKYLGIWIDDSLRFAEHIKNIMEIAESDFCV